MESEDSTSFVVDISQLDTHGFCPGYTLRRHKQENLANAGCHEARTDWYDYIGRVDKFGGCNPVNGNFTAVVLPLCKPDRLQLVAYILEYAFLHDNVVESINEASSDKGDEFTLGTEEESVRNVKAARKQLQAKMMVNLTSTDSVCAERVMRAWSTMLSRTLQDKSKDFNTLEEYLDFRIIDTGAPFVESTMVFGMGMTMSKEEDSELADIIRPCYASLALANDYFSFDREWEDAQQPDAPKPVNAVWLYMQWQGVDIATAKQLVREACNTYERQYLELCDEFRSSHAPVSDKVDRYLTALSYQVSGNVVWSLNCPRYHPGFRYDPNAGLEDIMTTGGSEIGMSPVDGQPVEAIGEHHRGSLGSVRSTGSPSVSSSPHQTSSRTASPATTLDSDEEAKPAGEPLVKKALGPEHLDAPFGYVSSLPSKGVRDKFIDALNLWAKRPEDTVSQIKGVINHLHTASLMMDDIEDGSELRRGHPAAHTVFGTPETINAGSFAIIDAVRQAKDLPIPRAVDITLEQLKDLHIGQSYDLHWTRHGECPSVEDYLDMVGRKTGGLFRLLSRLMCTDMATRTAMGVDELVIQIGIYFQIRDDYQNLISAEYESQKGFCEDLDEGKFSYPLVHCINTSAANLELRGILQQRREQGSLNKPLKLMALESMKGSGSMEHTFSKLKAMERQIEGSVARLEEQTGKKNWVMRLLLQKLSV